MWGPRALRARASVDALIGSRVGKACQRPALGACEVGIPWRRLQSPPVWRCSIRRPGARVRPGGLQCCGMISKAGAIGFNGEYGAEPRA